MAVQFKNAYGEVRFQPETRDGFRLYSGTWYDMKIPPRGKLHEGPEEWEPPTLYRSEKHANKRARDFERAEAHRSKAIFKEVPR